MAAAGTGHALRAGVAAILLAATAGERTVYLLDAGWRFQLQPNGSYPICPNANATFPLELTGQQCVGLSQVAASSADQCQNACCGNSTCQVWQWCAGGACSPQASCWIGALGQCSPQSGWVSRARSSMPSPAAPCTATWCQPTTNDSTWRALDLPHDFVVEGNFTPAADKSHGYLPYGIGLYRKHLTIPQSAKAATMWLDFDGIQTVSTVYLNGVFLGSHTSGYTASRYFVNASIVNFGADNVLAVKADATVPDGWWYDGGGIYRHVWLTVVSTPGPYVAPWGVYAPSQVVGPISWAANGAPFASSQLSPSVEVWNNASGNSQAFTVALDVFDPSGVRVGSSSGSGMVSPQSAVVWAPPHPIAMPDAALWHLVEPPLYPALYTLQVSLVVGSTQVDSVNVTFGVRTTAWNASTGFYLNGVPTKILGMANHQDFPAVGVAVPDVLQRHRIMKLKSFGANGWRTAHNPPTPALLDAADELGFLVWDENHRNGQDDQIPLLVKRDRNHPSVIIWSMCNEVGSDTPRPAMLTCAIHRHDAVQVLCNTANTTADAIRIKALIKSLDPEGGRPVSANYNDFVGPNNIEDLAGFDYSTSDYDQWHAEDPNLPCISSETSSAVSDRDEYANDPVNGYVSGYDVNYPAWGQSAQMAWGGIHEPNSQGILTRAFMSGGWTWTGWDYRGEPTPYQWPNVNSHFGILDLAGFPKDRYYWYQSWFAQPSPPVLHLFPHWNWDASINSTLDVWVFSNADQVELFVNGVSFGRKVMQQYAHVEWDAVPYAPGYIQAVAYKNSSGEPVAVAYRNTTGAPAALAISIMDGVGSQLVAGCADAALIQVQVVDAMGRVVVGSSNVVTFTVSGPATLAGTANGDPSSHVLNTAPTRPAFHGLVMAVVLGGDSEGTIVVTASAAGLPSASLQIPQVAPTPSTNPTWCHQESRL